MLPSSDQGVALKLCIEPTAAADSGRQRQDIIGCQIDISSVNKACNDILLAVAAQQSGYVCLANVHMCMEALDRPEFARVLDNAMLVLPDGRPILWGQRLLGQRQAKQVRGLDLVLALCAKAEQQGLRLGLYGGTDAALLSQLKMRLLLRFPLLRLSYSFAPPFRPLTATETADQLAAIQAAKVDILLVGLGCPKQEFWMAQVQAQLPSPSSGGSLPVMLGVGAVFDFLAGRKMTAPKLVQRLGLEWLFRLLSEPTRLTGRYLRHNPRFILRFGLQYIRGMIKHHG